MRREALEAAADQVADEVAGTRLTRHATEVPQWAEKPEVGGEPLPEGIRSTMAGPSGVGSAEVRIHRDVPAADEAGIAAYTTGQHVSFGRGQYAPETKAGQHVIAHELAHVAQQRAGVAGPGQAYGDPIPTVSRPTVSSMADYIELVRRIEAANPGRTALQIAQMIMRSKYFSRGFDWLLPSTAGAAGVAASGGVTAADVTTLSGEFDVDLSPSVKEDASHVITAIVAAAEHSAPGSGGAGGLAGHLVGSLPAGLSQLDVASWAGDPGSAAGEWMTAHPLPSGGGNTKQDYMDEYSPDSDMLGDVDGVAMTSTATAAGFLFDPSQKLSENMNRYYFPSGPRAGTNRRMHTFCSVLGLPLNPDGVTLSPAAIATMDARIQAFADWYTKNDPNILAWVTMNANRNSLFNPIVSAWVARAGDWKWFADKWRAFVQRYLSAEGP